MEPSTKETEIKLRFESRDEAVERLRRLSASLLQPRAFEDNIVYDDARRNLRASRKVLRLRTTGPDSVLTYKARPAGESRHKVREEYETRVHDPAAMQAILENLGFRPAYRYQKYRTRYLVDGVEVCVDETPLGCFVELEGEPEAIDDLAARLGFSPDDYILASYRGLQEEAAAEQGEPPGDMLMSQDGTSPEAEGSSPRASEPEGRS